MRKEGEITPNLQKMALNCVKNSQQTLQKDIILSYLPQSCTFAIYTNVIGVTELILTQHMLPSNQKSCESKMVFKMAAKTLRLSQNPQPKPLNNQ